jgi:hypothetical protein
VDIEPCDHEEQHHDSDIDQIHHRFVPSAKSALFTPQRGIAVQKALIKMRHPSIKSSLKQKWAVGMHVRPN